MVRLAKIAAGAASRGRRGMAATVGHANQLRKWTLASRRRTAVAGLLLAATIALTITSWVLLRQTVARMQEGISPQEVLAALDQRDFEQALRLAEDFAQHSSRRSDAPGLTAYVRGVIRAHDAAQEVSEERRRAVYRVSAEYLREAEERGLPPSREAEGPLLLARALMGAERFAEAAPVLERALEVNPQAKTELHRLASMAYLATRPADLEQAERHSRLELEDRTLPPGARAEALLRRGEILLRLDETTAAEEFLDEQPQEIREQPPVKLLRAQLLMARADAVENGDDKTQTSDGDDAEDSTPSISSSDVAAEYREAITLLRQLRAEAPQDSELSRRAMYLIGQCYARLPAESEAAVGQFVRLRQLFPETPEAVAASLAEGELLLAENRHEDAVAAFSRALLSVSDPAEFHNRWVTLEDLRRRTLAGYETLVEAEQFAFADALLEAFPPVFTQKETLSERTALWWQWGEQMLRDAELLSAAERDPIAAAARRKFRRAGMFYEDLSAYQLTDREYPDTLWQAAESYRRGHSFTQAARVLETYLAMEAVERRPQALVQLGRAYLAQGDLERSVAALQECIELHNHDAAVYQARLLAARAYQEQGETEQVEKLLRANLVADGLTPQSIEWRESLLALGRFYYSQQQYHKAIESLQEYVQRYAELPESVLARYLVAQSYRHAAREPLTALDEALTENERLKHRTRAREMLQAALTEFTQVQRMLTLKTADATLDRLESSILRNCYLLRGDVLFSLQEYEQALEVYRNASSLYQNEPVVLDAYVQIAWCHRKLGQLTAARGAIEQAKIVLERLPADAEFQQATAFDRQQWTDVLDDMSQWYVN